MLPSLQYASAPHRRERKFSGTSFYRVILKHLLQSLTSHILCFNFHWHPPIFVTLENIQKFVFLAAFFLLEKQGPRRKEEEERRKYSLAPMGVLALGCAHVGPSAQPPIDMSGNFLEHVSAESP